METLWRWWLASTLALVLIPQSVRADEPVSIGVLGDSYSDEYAFYPPDRSQARNWVEILAATRGIDFGPASAESRGEPRNQGYAFNWARSDATTVDLIATGQHTGLAAQVARGEVDLVVIFIGGNDFINAMKAPDPAMSLRETLPRALSNLRTAYDAIRAAGPGTGLMLGTLPDVRHLPEFAKPIADGTVPSELADACTAAIRRYNSEIRGLVARDPHAALIDLDLLTRAANLVSRDFVLVGGHKLNRKGAANDLDHFFLADVRHPGTLGQSLMARLVVDMANSRFGTSIPPLREREVLEFASSLPSGRSGIEALAASPTSNRAALSRAQISTFLGRSNPSTTGGGR